ncbi:Na+/H+ antiporter NhaC [Fusobacterium perfoetens]|uniref:Na+/H+ antiporter NhaC n=1 Tax=Fusobacterium perfoetens TaxID=852 RepID=UPI0006885E61|nr:Na+/H+ antiporter NhaC [Fusobacterium perfoetens]MCI6153111.1 Na+/H+ antiporter NhaC [Fusobacterium perfoetens]MDY3236923.1 Na+/H+ antiporter NhaC [Fusobacterium perfoetens]
MKKETTSKVVKETKFIHALIPLVFLIISLGYTIRYTNAAPHIPIIISGMLAACIAMFFLNYRWEVILEGILETIKSSMEAALILLIIGMVVGSWIISGVVPTMIFYGLKIMSPSIFLPATLLLSLIVAIATGSSWSTAATIGIALMGVGAGLGIPSPITAGAIISGAYMGDKLSPLSDTTNLAPAMAGSDLFDHIKAMLFTTIPAFVITIILFSIIGMKYSQIEVDASVLNSILITLDEQFYISPILFVVPLITIGLVVKKVPAIPGLLFGSIIGGIAAVVFQKVPLKDFITSLQVGYVSNSGNEMVDALLTRGGMNSMMWTVALIVCALFLGGVMEKTGMLNVLAMKILSIANSTGSLILATLLTALAVNILAAEQYLSIVITGRIFKDVYKEKNLHPVTLSRALEDSGTMTSPLIPWNSCGAYMIATLGIAPWTYVPYCFMNIISPIISCIYGYTGFTIKYLNKEEKREKNNLKQRVATIIGAVTK